MDGTKSVKRWLKQFLFLLRHGSHMGRLFAECTAIFQKAMAERNNEQFEAYHREHTRKGDEYRKLLKALKNC